MDKDTEAAFRARIAELPPTARQELETRCGKHLGEASVIEIGLALDIRRDRVLRLERAGLDRLGKTLAKRGIRDLPGSPDLKE